MIRVESSVIEAIGYDEGTANLTVAFLDGNVYEFYFVPRRIWKEFMSARSKGAFFNATFKEGAYGGRRIRHA